MHAHECRVKAVEALISCTSMLCRRWPSLHLPPLRQPAHGSCRSNSAAAGAAAAATAQLLGQLLQLQRSSCS